MKILLLGSDGLLGSELKKAFSKEHDLTAFVRKDLDITKKRAVVKKIQELKPDIIINAAAYTQVDDAENNKALAKWVNGYALGYLAKAANKVGAMLVHYSTDYVFGGDRQGGYFEDDAPACKPPSVYGQSKLLGEQELIKNTDNYYLIRTSWVFGAYGKNFVDTIIRLAGERDELRVVRDQHGSPTYAKDLAIATQELVETKMPRGIYHLTNAGTTNWYEYAKTIIGEYGRLQNWGSKEFPRIIPVTSKEFPTAAKRPEFSILNNTKFPPLRPWREALEEYLNSINK